VAGQAGEPHAVVGPWKTFGDTHVVATAKTHEPEVWQQAPTETGQVLPAPLHAEP
jgi:hypothetical protein